MACLPWISITLGGVGRGWSSPRASVVALMPGPLISDECKPGEGLFGICPDTPIGS